MTRGAVAALGFNYYALGKLSGKMAADILGGSSPSTMAVGTLQTQDLYLNMKSAVAMGVEVPESLKASAAKVINRKAGHKLSSRSQGRSKRALFLGWSRWASISPSACWTFRT